MDLVEKIIQYFSKQSVQAILRIGSTINQQRADFWSDTDLVILLDRSTTLDHIQPKNLFQQLGSIIAKEEHKNKDAYTIRMIITEKGKIKRLDLTILSHDFIKKRGSLPYLPYELLYGTIDTLRLSPKAPIHYPFDAKRVNQMWFLCYEGVKKFGRKDHLIGLHLLLELLQYYLELQMQARDIQYQTNVHRYGYAEELPANLSLKQLGSFQLSDLLDYIENLASAIDQILVQRFAEYESPLRHFLAYLNDCKQQSPS